MLCVVAGEEQKTEAVKKPRVLFEMVVDAAATVVHVVLVLVLALVLVAVVVVAHVLAVVWLWLWVWVWVWVVGIVAVAAVVAACHKQNHSLLAWHHHTGHYYTVAGKLLLMPRTGQQRMTAAGQQWHYIVH